jgi:hypothetical protein
MSNPNSNNAVCPESTIESANRRTFIRKAAIVTAAAAVGGTLLAKNVAPQSSAYSPGDFSCVKVCGAIQFDRCNNCNGNPDQFLGSLIFGCDCCTAVIGSQRRNCTVTIGLHSFPPGKNIYGLDFYTKYTKRMSITNSGSVGIGTCQPTSTLCVVGTITGSGGPGVQGKSSTSNGVFGCSTASGQSGVYGVGVTQGVTGFSADGYGVRGCSTNSIGVVGQGKCAGVEGSSGNGNGVFGCSTALCRSGVYGQGVTWGVAGRSTSGLGVWGASPCNTGVAGTGKLVGVRGISTASGGIPIVAQGAFCQTAPLQEWQNCAGTALSVVNKCGDFGIRTTNPQRVLCVNGKGHFNCGLGLGTQTINTTFALNGSMAARTRIVTKSYSMSTAEYAVIANSTSPITITLPAADTAGSFGSCLSGGMIVFIKNANTGAVTVKPRSTTDTIEKKTSIVLKKQYDSLQLISNGTNEWLLVGNSVCGAFES